MFQGLELIFQGLVQMFQALVHIFHGLEHKNYQVLIRFYIGLTEISHQPIEERQLTTLITKGLEPHDP